MCINLVQTNAQTKSLNVSDSVDLDWKTIFGGVFGGLFAIAGIILGLFFGRKKKYEMAQTA